MALDIYFLKEMDIDETRMQTFDARSLVLKEDERRCGCYNFSSGKAVCSCVALADLEEAVVVTEGKVHHNALLNIYSTE